MSRLLLINRRPDQRRVALIENGITTELFFERLRERSIVGNVYVGRVVRVLPGMQAAFVDAGLQRSGFLFVGDVARTDDDVDDDDDDGQAAGASAPTGRGDKYPPINTLLHQGQTILVQISKAPMGTKGARLTTHISLPGRHLVYMPTIDHIGISRRIRDEAERARLKAVCDEMRPEVGGLIVRTASEGVDAASLREDLDFLVALWREVRRKADVAEAPELVHEDLDLTLRSVRDLIQSDVDRIVVDDDDELARIQDFVSRVMARSEVRIERWDSHEPMMERFGVEWEITRASRRKVWLRSGGHILIDLTEALTAIDVNTGRYVGKANFEETIVEINLEAVREIAYQLRLRDIGGIIVVDFIDMDLVANRQRVTDALVAELRRDRARTKVLPMSSIGLIEMTRKRVRNSIVQSLTEPCFYCGGKGYLRSLRIIADGIILNLHQQLRGTTGKRIGIRAHPRVTELLVEDCQDELNMVERLYQAQLEIIAADVHLEHFDARLS